MRPESWVVICRADRQEDGAKGRFELATRRVFGSEREALDYAAGISDSREPLVAIGDFGGLRFPAP